MIFVLFFLKCGFMNFILSFFSFLMFFLIIGWLYIVECMVGVIIMGVWVKVVVMIVVMGVLLIL